jgi:hypothetical protein
MLELDNDSKESPVLTSADMSVPVFARFCGDSYYQSSAPFGLKAQLGSSSAPTPVVTHIPNESIHQYLQHFGHLFPHRTSFS